MIYWEWIPWTEPDLCIKVWGNRQRDDERIIVYKWMAVKRHQSFVSLGSIQLKLNHSEMGSGGVPGIYVTRNNLETARKFQPTKKCSIVYLPILPQKWLRIWMFPKIVVPPNHPFLIGFSIINHPFGGTTIFGNTHIVIGKVKIFHYGLIPL